MPWSALGSLASTIAGGIINYRNQKNMNRQARADNARAMAAQFRNNMMAQAFSPQMQVVGMKNAGISPAALNGHFSPAPSQSALGAASYQSPQVDLTSGIVSLMDAISNRMNADSNRMNADTNQMNADTNKMNADSNRMNVGINEKNAKSNRINADANELVSVSSAAKMDAETNNLVIQNERLANEDAMFKKYSMELRQMAVSNDPALESYPDAIRYYAKRLANESPDEVENVNKGTLLAIQGFNNFVSEFANADANVVSKRLEKSVLLEQIKSDKIRNAIANMPLAEFNHVNSLIAEITKRLPLISAQTNLTREQLNEVKANIGKLIAQKRDILSSNGILLLEDERYWQAALLGFSRVLPAATAVATKGKVVAKGVGEKAAADVGHETYKEVVRKSRQGGKLVTESKETTRTYTK